jgi:hypothetical protein
MTAFHAPKPADRPEAMAGMGYFDPFPPTRLNGRCPCN